MQLIVSVTSEADGIHRVPSEFVGCGPEILNPLGITSLVQYSKKSLGSSISWSQLVNMAIAVNNATEIVKILKMFFIS